MNSAQRRKQRRADNPISRKVGSNMRFMIGGRTITIAEWREDYMYDTVEVTLVKRGWLWRFWMRWIRLPIMRIWWRLEYKLGLEEP